MNCFFAAKSGDFAEHRVVIEKADNPIVDVLNLSNLQRYDLY